MDHNGVYDNYSVYEDNSSFSDYGIFVDEVEVPKERKYRPQPFKHGDDKLRPNTSGCSRQGHCYTPSAEALERENFTNSPYNAGKPLPPMYSNQPLYGKSPIAQNYVYRPQQDVPYRPLRSQMTSGPSQIAGEYLDINIILFIVLIAVIVYLVVSINSLKNQVSDLTGIVFKRNIIM